MSPGAFGEQIDENKVYHVSIYFLEAGSAITAPPGEFMTHYVTEGSVEVTLADKDGKPIETRTVGVGKGWLKLPAQGQQVKAEKSSTLFVITNSAPLVTVDIFERGKKETLNAAVFNPLSDYTVTKPWGCENWYVDTEVYVFKGIRMNTGFECSLQLHEQKIEVNLLLEGRAKLLLGQSKKANEAIVAHHKKGGKQSDFSMSAEEVEAIKGAIQPIVIGPGEGWKALNYDIHQVLSLETYYALEVSTPDVDDIIRLKDLYHRPGGRIESEHATPLNTPISS